MQSCDLHWQGVWRCFLSLQKLLSLCNSKDLLSLSSFKSVINFDFFNVLTAQLTPYCYHIIPICLKIINFFFSLACKHVEWHTVFLWFFFLIHYFKTLPPLQSTSLYWSCLEWIKCFQITFYIHITSYMNSPSACFLYICPQN